MVTALTAVTALVVIAKVTVVALAGTVTVAGTRARLRLLLAGVTPAPPAGAAAPSVTVPVLFAPPVTAVGLTLTPSRAAGGFTVSVAVLATPLYLAVRVTAVGTVTALVVTANVFVVAPAATVTEPGTVGAPLLLATVTSPPSLHDALPILTVPVLFAPPVTAVGLTLTPSRAAGGFTVSVAVFATPL